MNPADFSLIQKCIAKDAKAWDEFVGRYSCLIYDAIIRTLGRYGSPNRPEVIADLHNDIFLLIVENECGVLRQFEGRNGCQLGHYLRTVAIRRTVDYLRKIRPEVSLDADDSENFLDFVVSERHEGPEGGFAFLVRQERLDFLKQFMDELKGDEKRLCELLFQEGLSPQLIAQELEITVDYFYVRKKRLMNKLKVMAKIRENEPGNIL